MEKDEISEVLWALCGTIDEEEEKALEERYWDLIGSKLTFKWN